jgi:hypothetical protein
LASGGDGYLVSKMPGCFRVCGGLWLTVSIALAISGPLWTHTLLQRDSEASCLPEDFSGAGPEAIEALTAELKATFDRDGMAIDEGGAVMFLLHPTLIHAGNRYG